MSDGKKTVRDLMAMSLDDLGRLRSGQTAEQWEAGREERKAARAKWAAEGQAKRDSMNYREQKLDLGCCWNCLHCYLEQDDACVTCDHELAYHKSIDPLGICDKFNKGESDG